MGRIRKALKKRVAQNLKYSITPAGAWPLLCEMIAQNKVKFQSQLDKMEENHRNAMLSEIETQLSNEYKISKQRKIKTKGTVETDVFLKELVVSHKLIKPEENDRFSK